MKRSELIKILQETSGDYERDGEIEIHVFDEADEDPVVMTVIGTNVAAGSGDAITIIEVGRPLQDDAAYVRKIERDLIRMGVDPDRLVETVNAKIEQLKQADAA